MSADALDTPGSEFEEQPGEGSIEASEQLGVEQDINEGGDDFFDEAVGLEGTEFNSIEELIKGYKELQKTLTQRSQAFSSQGKEYKELRSYVEELRRDAQKQAGGSGDQKITDEQIDADVESMLKNGPKAQMREVVAEYVSEFNTQQQRYEQTRGTAYESAMKELVEDPDYSEIFTDEVLKIMDDMMENDPYVKRNFEQGITVKDFERYQPEAIQEYFKARLLSLAERAYGRNAKKVIPGVKAKATRDAKRKILRKNRLQTQKPSGKKKPMGAGGAAGEAEKIRAAMRGTTVTPT